MPAVWNPSQMNMPWTESPFFGELLAESGLSAADRALAEAFSRDGYAVLTPGDHSFPALAEDLRARPPAFDADRGTDLWRADPRVKSLALHPEILAAMRMLYRREPVAFQTLNFTRGTEQHTHSDAIHFHAYPQRFLCGAWVALEDIDENNGPLHVYPGSHRLPLYDMHDFGLPSSRDCYPEYERAIGRLAAKLGLQKHAVTVKAGQVVLWAANLLHGGDVIRDRSRTRMSQVTHYVFRDCLYYVPILSDPFAGSVRLRTITDIATGKTVPHIHRGKPLAVSAEQEFWQRPSFGAFAAAVLARCKVGVKRLLK
ncbi:MAG TPA: phytanoyl-CoA dioxygenase family protein [Candidatus Peribacteria bacterium]|nr:phytanoyl-CoA dioxygenase family protein [Candidatus Peribacteria bacterium]